MSEENILSTVKSATNVSVDDDIFDTELLGLINMSLADIHQMGVGTIVPVTSETEFSSILTSNDSSEAKIYGRQYIILNTKALFDTPATGKQGDNLNAAIAQLVFRLSISNTNIDRVE